MQRAPEQLALRLPRRPPPRPPRPGRPRKYSPGDERHARRPRLNGREPVLVTLRTVEGVKYLRNRDVCRAIRSALETTFRRDGFRVCQISIQTGHLHLIVEAKDHVALARGMQGFQISAAKQLNRAFSRRNGVRCRGKIFADRYHARVQATPRQVRNALRYVLGNWRRHGEDRGLAYRFDPCSSAATFDGWQPGRAPPAVPTLDGLPVALPHTWLLAVGWRRHGLLSPLERPGPAPRAATRHR